MTEKKSKKRTIKSIVKDVEEEVLKPIEREKPIRFDKVVSTGSTLLDLIICGGRNYEGGIPGGIIVEIYGPSQAGKTALIAEIAGSVQYNGGEAEIKDPEARFDKEYSRIYGVEINKDNYSRPDTVNEMFDSMWEFKPKNPEAINGIFGDSIAALSTEMEMIDKDKMGMKRAKDFSENLRKTARIIANNNWLIVFSNQERDGTNGITTPGGRAVPYYSSLRIRIAPEFTGGKIKKTKTINGKPINKIIGIRSKCSIKKSIDEPYRECNVSIIFGFGIDDIRENLMYLKTILGGAKYDCITSEYATIDKAIEHIEKNNLEEQLRQKVIETWHDVEKQFKIIRKKRIRR